MRELMLILHFIGIAMGVGTGLKLTLVALLVTLIILIAIASGKAKKGDAEGQMKKIAQLGKFTLPISIIIVILAVYIFH